MSEGLVLHADGHARCWWCGTDPLYVTYHDTEWGVPERDGRALYEKLILDGFQAGLSWITILRKRDAFRRAFADFEPEQIARFTEAHVEALMLDAGIVRNRAKIDAAIGNAAAFIAIQAEFGSFAAYQWRFSDGRVVQGERRTLADVPATTPLAEAMAKDLRRRGFRFLGPTVIYAHLQATGVVNDHLLDCFRHDACG